MLQRQKKLIMKKMLFDLYIKGSIHVSMALLSLTVMTYLLFKIPIDENVLFFVFFSTIAGYNYTKYSSFIGKKKTSCLLKIIINFTFLSSILSLLFFFRFNLSAQILILTNGIFTFLYLFPIFKGTNFRNQKGIKIYVVSACWVASSLLLPLIQAQVEINKDIFIKSLQRFLLVTVLILIFEIIDLKEDDPNLKTVPQTIGVQKTKVLGISLLIPFYFLDFFLSYSPPSQWIINGILVLIIVLFMYFSSEEKSKIYTAFWVESIPILWLLLMLAFSKPE